MSNILERIIADKKLEVRQRMVETPVGNLEKSPYFKRVPLSLKESLIKKESSGIIAEFKRMSPSAGRIHKNADPVDITRGYVNAGATAISVLTDGKYFAGTRDDLMRAREVNQCPILRKDFMIDEYQVLETKAIGADAILLIASILDNSSIRMLAEMAHSVGLEVLLEIHEISELVCLNEWIDLVGVNNRNLKIMECDVETSISMAGMIPDEFMKISESGIHDPETINYLKKLGYKGFLIGEYFMKQEDPVKACRKFIEKIKHP
ncbi:indole-3-glycerol phosphate synthase TrpC [Bacteroidota bacterium]